MLLLFGEQKSSEGKMDISKGHQLMPFAALIAVGLPRHNVFVGLSACIFSLDILLANLPFLAL